MAVESRVWSSLVMAVLLGSVVIGSVIRKKAKRDQNPLNRNEEREVGSNPFIRDVAGVIISFCRPADWFALNMVDQLFHSQMQTGINQVFHNDQHPFRLGICKSLNPWHYFDKVNKCLSTAGMRCAIIQGKKKCTVINGGPAMIDDAIQSDLLSLADRVKQIIRDPIVTFGDGYFQINGDRSMMASISNENGDSSMMIKLWNIDYHTRQRTLIHEQPLNIPKDSKPSNIKAVAFGKDGSMNLVLGYTALSMVQVMDLSSEKTRGLLLDDNEEELLAISPDGRTVIHSNGLRLRVFNTPLMMGNQQSDDSESSDNINHRCLRFEMVHLINLMESSYAAHFSDDGKHIIFASSLKGNPSLQRNPSYLLNLINGESSKISDDCEIANNPWINPDFFQIGNKVRSVKYPSLDLPLDRSIIRRITRVKAAVHFHDT